MVIEGDMQGVVSSDGAVNPVSGSSINLVVHEVPEVSLFIVWRNTKQSDACIVLFNL